MRRTSTIADRLNLRDLVSDTCVHVIVKRVRTTAVPCLLAARALCTIAPITRIPIQKLTGYYDVLVYQHKKARHAAVPYDLRASNAVSLQHVTDSKVDRLCTIPCSPRRV